MHSSRMRTGRSLTVCCSLLPRGVSGPGGVSAPRGSGPRGGVSAPWGSGPGGLVPGGGGLVPGVSAPGGIWSRGWGVWSWGGVCSWGVYPSMH